MGVHIPDNLPGRSLGTRTADVPPDLVAEQIRGPYRFADAAPLGTEVAFKSGDDAIGRGMQTRGMDVGGEQVFILEPTYPPSWSGQALEDWREQQGTVIRFELFCHRKRGDWSVLAGDLNTVRDSWMLAGEIDTARLPNTVDVPQGRG